MFSKTSTYLKSYDDETKWMHFLIKYDDLLQKKDKDISNKVTNAIKKNLIVNPSKINVF